MTKLWVKFKSSNATRVSSEGCLDVKDFLKACKKELSPLLDPYATAQLSLSTPADVPSLSPEDPIPAQNTEKSPMFISVTVAEQEKMVSMSYGKAPLPFISEATGVKDYCQVWDSIPVDMTVEASQEFIDLFMKNSTVIDFESDASRRIVIDLFLRDIVYQFPDFIVVCEYHMTLENNAKKRKLKGNCDYTICHRGHRNLPHLVAIEAKGTNEVTMLQCIGECATIHYHRKSSGKHQNLCVYGIHSTASIWKFVFIDETGSLFVSRDYHLNHRNYVKEEIDLIYRLVYYVVKQSHTNSPRITPVGSSAALNE